MDTEKVIEKIRQKNFTIATAESCTGGLLAATITDVCGVSDVFKGGIIAYANEVKHDMLHVPQAFLDTYGAVSEQVAKALSTSISDLINADVGIGITGVAGPAESENKPVGLVYYSVYIRPQNVLICEKLQLKGTRAQIRTKTVAEVLQRLDNLL